MSYANPDALVSTDWLAQHLDAPDVRVVDGSYFMAETGRGSGILKDAYFLMNQDGLLKDAEKKGAKSLAKKISGSNSVPSVKTGTAGGGGGNIYDDALALTPSEMAGRLDNMTEGQMKDFINKAPAKVKARFPGIDWDPL